MTYGGNEFLDKCKIIDVLVRKCFSVEIKNVALKISIGYNHYGNHYVERTKE